MNTNTVNILITAALTVIAYLILSFVNLSFGWILGMNTADGDFTAAISRFLLLGFFVFLGLHVIEDWE